jgi:RNA polymerase sigma-70 factor (ECF subfamily)
MSATAYTDVLLMMQVRDGNTGMFDSLVQRYRDDLIGYLYRMVENRSVAEDLAQETFLRAYRSRAGYRPTAKFTTWLYSIAIRLALNWLRDNRGRRLEPIEGEYKDGRPRELADRAPLADQALIAAHRVRSVRRALAELPERQRTVVLMHKYQDMTYEEIATALGCSSQAVKSMLFRAHTNLRHKLSEALAA